MKMINKKPNELVKSYFVKGAKDSFSLLRWNKFKLESGDQVEAPAEWSTVAVQMAFQKYFRKTEVPKTGSEISVKQMILRVAKVLQKESVKQGFLKPKDAKIFFEELKYILASQRAFFNSPVWFNCGLWDSYRIKGDDQHWVWNRKPVLEKGVYKHPQVSACFIQSVEDSMDGIYELLKSEAKLFKFGSGSGTNFSSLRSRFEKLSGGGTSSGLMSFLEIFDKSAGSIKSGGTTRRAAKMVCLDLDHPELLDFINWKRAEEKKAKVLIQNGYQDGFEGEAFRSVSGQNSNNSVRITDQFMKALKSKQSVDLKFRSDGKSWKSLPAQDIWKNIAEAAWECADPGLQFHDTINQWHTCVASGEIRASNPCSEFMFLDDSACNLASINLLKFFDNQGHFLVDDFIHTVRTVFLAQELLVDYAGYPTEKICQNSHDYRPLGMGICGLGAALMSAGVPYDSEQGRNRASEISALMQASCFMQSTVFAKIKGAFAGYSKNKKHVQLVHKMHFEFVKNLSDDLSVKDRIVGQFLVALRNLSKTGIRNSQLTVIAPTGTIGLVMDCETTGIEPEFSLVKFKTLAGGGSLKFISSSLFKGLAARGYQESEIKKIEKHLLEHQGIEGAIKDQDLAVFDCAMKNGVGKRFIKPEAHLLMMAAVQPFISGAISKTVNLPMDTTVDEISDLYFRAWELGLKSVAIYREGSKLSEPLTRGKVGQSLDPFTEIKCVDCGG